MSNTRLLSAALCLRRPSTVRRWRHDGRSKGSSRFVRPVSTSRSKTPRRGTVSDGRASAGSTATTAAGSPKALFASQVAPRFDRPAGWAPATACFDRGSAAAHARLPTCHITYRGTALAPHEAVRTIAACEAHSFASRRTWVRSTSPPRLGRCADHGNLQARRTLDITIPWSPGSPHRWLWEPCSRSRPRARRCGRSRSSPSSPKRSRAPRPLGCRKQS